MSEQVVKKMYRPWSRWRLAAGVISALLLMYGMLLIFSALIRPNVDQDQVQYTAQQIQEVQRDRQMPSGRPQPIRVSVEVPQQQQQEALRYFNEQRDSSQLPAWYPKAQSPLLDPLVKDGVLEPVDQRVGPEPLVMRGCDGLGQYGGTWLRVANSQGEVGRTVGWRLGNAALARFSPMGQPVVPYIARDFTSSDDAKVWTVTLRNIRWSDGVPVTSEDISYLWHYEWLDKKIGGGMIDRRLYVGGKPATLQVIDEHRLRFVFPESFLLFPQVLTLIQPVPSHYLKQYHPKNI